VQHEKFEEEGAKEVVNVADEADVLMSVVGRTVVGVAVFVSEAAVAEVELHFDSEFVLGVAGDEARFDEFEEFYHQSSVEGPDGFHFGRGVEDHPGPAIGELVVVDFVGLGKKFHVRVDAAFFAEALEPEAVNFPLPWLNAFEELVYRKVLGLEKAGAETKVVLVEFKNFPGKKAEGEGDSGVGTRGSVEAAGEDGAGDVVCAGAEVDRVWDGKNLLVSSSIARTSFPTAFEELKVRVSDRMAEFL